MAGPWERFQKAEAGPWSRFQQPKQPVGQTVQGVDFAGRFDPEKEAAYEKSSWLDPAMQGLTFGFSDEIMGGVGGLASMIGGKGFGEGYEKMRDATRDSLAAYQERHPGRAMAAEIGGAIPTALLPVGHAARGAGLLSKVGRGAGIGAAYGGAYGAGTADGDMGDRLAGARSGAIAGGATGAVLPLAARGLGKVYGARAGAKAVPTTENLQQASSALYKAAKQQGLTINPNSFANMATTLIRDLNAAGIDRGIQPKAFAAASRIISAAKKGVPPALDDIDIFRQIAGGITGDFAAGKNEHRIARIIVKSLDNFMDSLKPGDVVSGNPKAAVQLIGQARSLWKAKAKASLIEEAVARAKNQASGFENGLRAQFRQLLAPKNAFRWTKDERKAIERVVRGNFGSNMLRLFGTFGIPIDQGRNWLGAFLGGGGLSATLGPVVGGAAVLGGTGAKYGARAMTKGFANKAGTIARSGGVTPFDAVRARLAEQRANKLLGAGGRALVPQLLPDQ